MNPSDWDKDNLATQNGYEYNIQIYQKEMGFISDDDKIRKEFVMGQISKEKFIDDSNDIKKSLKMMM